jgi:hypothetical protein
MADKVEMVNLRNINSGALVSVVAEKAARMGSEWESADGAPTRAPAKRAAPRKQAAKKAAAKAPTPAAVKEAVAEAITGD